MERDRISAAWTDAGGSFTRRQLLRGGAGAAALLPLPGLLSGLAGTLREAPPGFPANVQISRRRYENWCTGIQVDGLWTSTPTSAAQVLEIVNWAHGVGWTARGRGAMHGWSPLTITPDENRNTRTILIDTSGLESSKLISGADRSVKFGAGTRLLDLLTFLQSNRLGFGGVPATGAPSIAGALSIGPHGAVLPADGEATNGRAYGTLSNLVLELTAVVWDSSAGSYVLKTFSRTDPEMDSLMVHLGRTIVTDVTMRAADGQNLRCQSFTDIAVGELFAPPGASGRTFESFIANAGRVEAIWYPFTTKPWLKVWSVAASKPGPSREVTGAYNYPFSDLIPEPVAKLAGRIVLGDPAVAPEFGQAQYAVTDAGLTATDSRDLWGPAKNTQLYIRASTLRFNQIGYSILCARADIQRVVHLLTARYSEQLAAFQAAKSFPMNGPVEIRCCGVDDPAASGISGARAPAIASTSARTDHPEWDSIVWINCLTLPNTPDAYAFFASTSSGSWRRSTARGLGRGQSGRSCGPAPTARRGPMRRCSGRRSRPSSAPATPRMGTSRRRWRSSMRSIRTGCSRMGS